MPPMQFQNTWVYNCNKQFVAECLISSVVLLPISLYFSIFVFLILTSSFWMTNSATLNKQCQIRKTTRPQHSRISTSPTKYDSAWIPNDSVTVRLRESLHLPNFLGYAPRSLAMISSPIP
jgi:hypothetical protein